MEYYKKNYLKRGWQFAKKHLFKNTRFLLEYALNYFNPKYILDIKYYEMSDLVNLLEQRKSLIRLGDGEIYIMNFGSIHYQDYDPELRNSFVQMVKEYDSHSKYVLGLSRISLEQSNKQLKKDNLFNCWFPSKVYWFLDFNKKAKYFDAHSFYRNETIPTYLETYFKNKHLIWVTNQGNIVKLQQNKNIPFTNVSYIETSDTNAFSEFISIKDEIRKEVAKYSKEHCLVLVACGPASKAIAFTLSKEDIVTVDIGRGIEVAYTDERIDQMIYPVKN